MLPDNYQPFESPEALTSEVLGYELTEQTITELEQETICSQK